MTRPSARRRARPRIRPPRVRPLAWLVALAALAPTASWAELAPLPRSVEVRTPGAYVRTSASARGSRRGTLAFRSRLRPLERVYTSDEGCPGPWYRIGAEAWVCSVDVGASSREPDAVQLPVVAEGEVVPGRYGFAGPDGARLYRSVEGIDADDWEREFDPSSGLHLSRLVDHGGLHYYRLAEGGYVAADEVRPARPSTYAGLLLEEGAEGVGFVEPRRRVRVRPRAGGGRVARSLGPRSAFLILERTTVGRALWLRIGEAEWVGARRIVMPREPEPPDGLGSGERWIDVDTASQLLVAYEGARPVFATLVSTGRRGAATPRGTFRIWAKLATGSMSDEGEDLDSGAYLMQGVPWVMYFNEGIALHGAYWHDQFGRRRSHGCVNLAPRDAAWLFDWTSPRLPLGWQGVLPTRTEPGTLVVVR